MEQPSEHSKGRAKIEGLDVLLSPSPQSASNIFIPCQFHRLYDNITVSSDSQAPCMILQGRCSPSGSSVILLSLL